MSEIIAETNGKQGILMADTLVTAYGEDLEMAQWNERKIYGTHHCQLIHACMGTLNVGHNMVDELEKMENIYSQDFYRIFDNQLQKLKDEGIDASHSIVFSMYTLSEKVKIAYCVQNEDKDAFELVNQKKVVVPGDTSHKSYLSKCDVKNIFAKEHLEELVKEFIDISEQSKYVSDTCCIATMNSWGIIEYYEDNMYKMLENIKEKKMKSNIAILAQSTPAFMRAGILNPIPFTQDNKN